MVVVVVTQLPVLQLLPVVVVVVVLVVDPLPQEAPVYCKGMLQGLAGVKGTSDIILALAESEERGDERAQKWKE